MFVFASWDLGSCQRQYPPWLVEQMSWGVQTNLHRRNPTMRRRTPSAGCPHGRRKLSVPLRGCSAASPAAPLKKMKSLLSLARPRSVLGWCFGGRDFSSYWILRHAPLSPPLSRERNERIALVRIRLAGVGTMLQDDTVPFTHLA